MRLVSWFLMIAALAAGCAGTQPALRSDESLGVQRVVMFQNGLTYIERRGAIDSRTVELQARRDQVDDVLKSLTVVDHGGSKVASVRVVPGAEDDEVVTLQVGLAEDGRHDLSISYVAAISGWRPTYRLVADDEGQVRLQGMAVVDNRSGEAWRDITLSLSTEVPLSFRYDLRTPRAARRPELDGDGRLITSGAPEATPTTASPLLASHEGSNVQAAYAHENAYLPQMSHRAGVRLEGGQPEGDDEDGDDPMRALARAGGLDGALLEGIGGFSLADGESGLVPFVDQQTEGQLVLLYKPATRSGPSSTRPYHAALVRNPLDAPLLTGPVAVYREDRFLGDGVTGTIPANAHAFVAFALAPSVEIEQTTARGEDHLRALSLRGGTLRVEVQATQRTSFQVTSSRPLDTPLYLFVPALEGYDPREAPDGTIATAAGYYVPAAEGQSSQQLDFVIQQQRTTEVDISSSPTHHYTSALIELVESSAPEEAARLTAIVNRLEELATEQRRWSQDLSVHRQALNERRLALESLEGIAANGALRRRLAASVAEGVARVDDLTRHRVEANAESIALRQEWFERLRAMSL